MAHLQLTATSIHSPANRNLIQGGMRMTTTSIGSDTQAQAQAQSAQRSQSAQTPVPVGQVTTEGDLRDGIDAGDPLTAKGRSRKRQRDKDNHDPDDPDRYRYRAYHIRRAFDLFGHIPTIVNEGIKRRAKEAAGEDVTNIQNDRDFETFNLIINHLDGLNEDITRFKRNPKAFRALIRKIREAADQARNNDTANLKKDIACMLTPDGTSVLTMIIKGKKASSKHDRGFDNDVMGRYLCPISLDWDNPFVREEIREGKHAILACDWPRLLYADCDCNLDDLEQGLGRNLALVRVVKYLFTGRSAAFSETAGGKTTRSGNAAIAGMTEITPRVVAYAACMLRYAISNEESWSNIDKEFNLHEFYWHVVSIFDDSDAFGQELLAWWNLKVFGTSLETTSKRTPTVTAALSLLKHQREAKRTQTSLRDVTNQQNTCHTQARGDGSEDEVCAHPAANPHAQAGQHCPEYALAESRSEVGHLQIQSQSIHQLGMQVPSVINTSSVDPPPQASQQEATRRTLQENQIRPSASHSHIQYEGRADALNATHPNQCPLPVADIHSSQTRPRSPSTLHIRRFGMSMAPLPNYGYNILQARPHAQHLEESPGALIEQSTGYSDRIHVTTTPSASLPNPHGQTTSTSTHPHHSPGPAAYVPPNPPRHQPDSASANFNPSSLDVLAAVSLSKSSLT